jgi:hypothetical protein
LTAEGLQTAVAERVSYVTVGVQQPGAYFGTVPLATPVLDPATFERQARGTPRDQQ